MWNGCMSEMHERVCSWENLMLAYQKASRGKRGKHAAALFEYRLADNLCSPTASSRSASTDE